jgi:hypothetical protein
MNSRRSIVAAVAVAALLALAGSAWAEGIVITDANYRLALVAHGEGSWNWTGQCVAMSQIRVEITDGGEVGGGWFYLYGVVTDSRDATVDGWRFSAVANADTGFYSVQFSFSNQILGFYNTGMVRILP